MNPQPIRNHAPDHPQLSAVADSADYPQPIRNRAREYPQPERQRIIGQSRIKWGRAPTIDRLELPSEADIQRFLEEKIREVGDG